MLSQCRLALYRGIGFKNSRFFGKGSNPNEEDGEGDDKIIPWVPKFVDAFDEVDRTDIVFPPEIQAKHDKILKRYVAESRKQIRLVKKSFSLKIYLMWDAIHALPPDLQKAARELDLTPFPERDLPSYTPPIKGFDPSKYM